MIVVFGACGFVGAYLTAGMNKKEIIVVDKKQLEMSEVKKNYDAENYYCDDIRDPSTFAWLPTKNISCVINLASCQPANISKNELDIARYVQTNTIGTINILDYCIKNKIPKLIQVVSHRSVINQQSTNGCGLDEEAPYAIDYESEFAEFAVSEMAAIEMINCYAVKYNMQNIILRVPSIFGYGPYTEGYQKGEYKKTGFQIFIENAIAEKKIEVWGNSDLKRDIIYIKDVISAIKKAIASKTAKGLYNISSGKGLSLREEAEIIYDYFSLVTANKEIVYKPKKKNNIDPCHYDISKAKDDLDWKPQYTSFWNMLRDYNKERINGRFDFLIEERKGRLCQKK